jgi:hypothetical protein
LLDARTDRWSARIHSPSRFAKLGVDDRTAAVPVALERGLLKL